MEGFMVDVKVEKQKAIDWLVSFERGYRNQASPLTHPHRYGFQLGSL